MRRKSLFTVMMCVVLLFSLTACTKPVAKDETDTEFEELSEEVFTSDEELEEEISEDEFEDESYEDESDEVFDEEYDEDEPEEEEVPEWSFDTSATISETVLVDENGIKITAKKLTYSDYEANLELLIENKSSGDVTVDSGTIESTYNSVNGYMICDGYLSTLVPAGQSSTETVTIDTDYLMSYGITKIADIQMTFETTDEDYNIINYSQRQVKTSAAGSYNYATNVFENGLKNGIMEYMYGSNLDFFHATEKYNQCNVKIVSEAVASSVDGEKTILLDVVSSSDRPLCFIVQNITANGVMIYEGEWTNMVVNPGKHQIVSLDMGYIATAEELKSLGITQLSEVKFEVTLQDVEYNEVAAPMQVTVNVTRK